MAKALAVIAASLPRRVITVGVIGAFGAFLIAIAVFRPPETTWLHLLVIAIGAGFLGLADLHRRATALRLELTAEALTDSSGRIVARVADILTVDRGVFALKPSNGFVMRLRQPLDLVWAPGLWWRIGRRVGVGGVISKTDGRNMADLISLMIAERDRGGA